MSPCFKCDRDWRFGSRITNCQLARDAPGYKLAQITRLEMWACDVVKSCRIEKDCDMRSLQFGVSRVGNRRAVKQGACDNLVLV